METKFLFREDPYLTKCISKVIMIEGNKIQLDQTCFYALSGGQISDSGKIGGINVLQAEKDKGIIIYTLETEPNFNIGSEVEVIIDKDKREKVRRLHSAIHIVGDIFERKYNISINDIIGSSVDDKKGRLDYNFDKNLNEVIEELELEINNFLSKNLEIKHYKKEGDKWEWECNNFICPCGGTHVRNTKEIGEVKLKRKNIGGGKERIEVYLK